MRPDAGSFLKRGGYYVRPSPGVLDSRQLRFEFASIAILIAGFIMAALFAIDLLDMR